MARQNDSRVAQELQDVFQKKEGLQTIVEAVIQKLIEEEAESHIGAGPYERSETRRGYRNGRKPRSLKTRVGELNFNIPQVRDCQEGPYQPSMLLKWQRSEKALLTTCAEIYFQGVSTRSVQNVMKKMGGMDLSAGQVSRIAADLDEHIDQLRDRRLTHTAYPFLLVDARYENIRSNGQIVNKAVLVTIGINIDGRREILDWRVADSESEETWSEVFRSLKDRGLKGLKMVTSDAHKGIKKGIKRHFQGVLWQRCRVHFKRNVLNKSSWKVRKILAKELRGVFKPEERKECIRRAEEMAERWESKYPSIAKILRTGIEECLTVCILPSELRRKLCSTNMVERQMQYLKKRTAVVRIFPNAASCERLIGARLVELHEKWAVEPRRYLNMEHLGRPEYHGIFDGIGMNQK